MDEMSRRRTGKPSRTSRMRCTCRPCAASGRMSRRDESLRWDTRSRTLRGRSADKTRPSSCSTRVPARRKSAAWAAAPEGGAGAGRGSPVLDRARASAHFPQPMQRSSWRKSLPSWLFDRRRESAPQRSQKGQVPDCTIHAARKPADPSRARQSGAAQPVPRARNRAGLCARKCASYRNQRVAVRCTQSSSRSCSVPSLAIRAAAPCRESSTPRPPAACRPTLVSTDAAPESAAANTRPASAPFVGCLCARTDALNAPLGILLPQQSACAHQRERCSRLRARRARGYTAASRRDHHPCRALASAPARVRKSAPRYRDAHRRRQTREERPPRELVQREACSILQRLGAFSQASEIAAKALAGALHREEPLAQAATPRTSARSALKPLRKTSSARSGVQSPQV
jgi:hypothetical protein